MKKKIKIILIIYIFSITIQCKNKIHEFSNYNIIFDNIDFEYHFKSDSLISYDLEIKEKIELTKQDKRKLANSFFKYRIDTISSKYIGREDNVAIIPDTGRKMYKINNYSTITISGLSNKFNVKKSDQDFMKFDSIVNDILIKNSKINEIKTKIEENDKRIWM